MKTRHLNEHLTKLVSNGVQGTMDWIKLNALDLGHLMVL